MIKKINPYMKSFTKIQISSKKINNPNKNDLIEKVEESSETEIKDPVSLFFSKLFESREMAHVYHLQVSGDEGSYAAHVALNSYYDDVGIILLLMSILFGIHWLARRLDKK